MPTDESTNDDFNSAFLFDPDGNCGAFITSESSSSLANIFRSSLAAVREMVHAHHGSYEAGNVPAQFEINRWGERPREPLIELNSGSPEVSPRQTVNAAPLICFEDMFPQTARDSVQGDTDFLVNLTNDGWFGEGAEQWQQAAAAIFRAVENGVPLVRCCNNGVTCWIDAHGPVRQIFKDNTGGIYGAGAMTFELPLPDEKPAPTFYNRHGDWFGWACALVTMALVFCQNFAPQKDSSLNSAKTAVPLGVFLQRGEKLRLAEIRPERRRDDQFGVGNLPEQKIADAHLAAGADEQVGVGNVRASKDARK